MFRIKPMHPIIYYPTKAHDGDAGFDVYSHSPTQVLGLGERYRFRLGFSLELPSGWMALIQEKSGMALNSGLFTIGNVIDSGYRGEVHAIICCMSESSVTIECGQKIAQMLILPCYTGKEYQIVEDLTESPRGEKGFGSSGL